MDLKSFRLDSLSPGAQVGLFALLAAGLAGAFYFVWMQEPLQECENLRAEVGQLENSLAQSTAVASQLQRFKKELADLEMRLTLLRSILPAQKETPEVLKSVQQMAASSNLKIVKFNPQPVVPRAFYSDWPIRIEVQGSYDALGQFFEKVGQATRIINVENISVKGIEGSTDRTRTLNAACTATTFVFREDDAAPAN